jgi:hypothetical protein
MIWAATAWPIKADRPAQMSRALQVVFNEGSYSTRFAAVSHRRVPPSIPGESRGFYWAWPILFFTSSSDSECFRLFPAKYRSIKKLVWLKYKGGTGSKRVSFLVRFFLLIFKYLVKVNNVQIRKCFNFSYV